MHADATTTLQSGADAQAGSTVTTATVIASRATPGAFLRMDATGVTGPSPTGGGVVNCQYGADLYERLSLEPRNDGSVSVRSQNFAGAYLRLNASDLPAGDGSIGGQVNCQHGAGPWEKFKLERQRDGSVALASVAFPGVYLRMDGTGVVTRAPRGAGTVNCRRGVGDRERFWLVDVPLLGNDERSRIVSEYAPLVWLAKDEEYLPSSVEFAFPHLKRFRNDDDGGRYWLRTRKTLDEPSDELPYFQGERNLSAVPAYAFWVDKPGLVTDVVYFFYFPYNRGKSVLDTVWGNHVSDWEHATVRFNWARTDNRWTPVPFKLALSTHDSGEVVLWPDIAKVPGTNHPVAYSARGSHGIWSRPGAHEYKNLVVAQLVDQCSAGTAWHTWERLLAFDYTSKSGLKGEAWPLWMRTDYTGPGHDPTDDPASGPVYRWGNEARGCDLLFPGLPCRLEDGPTGPPDKDVWDPRKFE